MRIYYLDKPLTGRNLAFVKCELELSDPVEQVRVPHVFPLIGTDTMAADRELEREQALLQKNLRHAGISRDRGKRIAFVAPSNMRWAGLLIMAIHAETGSLPFIIQTSQQRRAIGNRGSVRIIDAEYTANG
jgi:hypothetical protein